jgi:hypothetical protein
VAPSSGGGSVLIPVTVLQQWTRLIRFVAAETSQVHIGQPVDPQLDSEATYLTGVRITNLCLCVYFSSRPSRREREEAGLRT